MAIIAPNKRRTFKNKRPQTPPKWKSYYHIIYTITFCAIGITIPLMYLNNVLFAELMIVPLTFVVANIVEYIIHRWPMHHKKPGAGKMIELHMIHHHYFNEDTYRINKFEDFAMIVFPPHVLNIVAFAIAPIFTFATWYLLGKNPALLFFATVIAYYLLMQIIHVLTHVDKNHWVASMPGIKYLWVHHKIHHARECMTKTNFNFIVPLFDFAMGTSTQNQNLINGNIEIETAIPIKVK